jgi:protein-S-isoprenylcysteine O-methyltransferase Ste14
MKATTLEFRFRFLIHALIYLIGFVAPWNFVLHYDTIRTWQFLAAYLNRSGLMGFSAATIAVLSAGIALAVAAAAVRTWGTAYLGAAVVHDGGLVGGAVVAAGPYRYVRNPLYLGTVLHTLALCLLMPPTGAAFCVVAIVLVQLRLIGAEEPFLTAKLAESYASYSAKVPRLLPAIRPRVAASAAKPMWGAAFVGEIYFWGAALSFAVAGWRYNAQLVMQGVIVSLGVSLVARAFLPKR